MSLLVLQSESLISHKQSSLGRRPFLNKFFLLYRNTLLHLSAAVSKHGPKLSNRPSLHPLSPDHRCTFVPVNCREVERQSKYIFIDRRACKRVNNKISKLKEPKDQFLMDNAESLMLALLSEKMNLLDLKEEAVNKLSLELMAVAEREAQLMERYRQLQTEHKRLKHVADLMDKDGPAIESLLHRIMEREEKVTRFTQKCNYLEKENEILKQKISFLTAKIDSHYYLFSESNVSDEKLMEKKDLESKDVEEQDHEKKEQEKNERERQKLPQMDP